MENELLLGRRHSPQAVFVFFFRVVRSTVEGNGKDPLGRDKRRFNSTRFETLGTGGGIQNEVGSSRWGPHFAGAAP